MKPKYDARDVARSAIGRRTIPNGKLIDSAVVRDGMVYVTFAGSGMAPFRSAYYSPKDVLVMLGDVKKGAR